MGTFVLVHGGWSGGWCWDKVVPLLEEAGHEAHAPDLPGSGDDPTPIHEVSLQGYADRISEVLDAQPGPVVLVGHSSGGTVISQAAEQRPEKVKLLVYLAAFLLRDGESLFEVGENETRSLVLPNLVVSEDGASATIKEDVVVEALLHDCSEEDAERAKARFVPQALAPFATPLSLTEGNFGRVPRAYIPRGGRGHGLQPIAQQALELARARQRPHRAHVPHGAAVHEHVRRGHLAGSGRVRRRHLAVGSRREPLEHPVVTADVDDLEAVAGSLEEAPGTPAAQRRAAGVEDHLPLVQLAPSLVPRGTLGRRLQAFGTQQSVDQSHGVPQPAQVVALTPTPVNRRTHLEPGGKVPRAVLAEHESRPWRHLIGQVRVRLARQVDLGFHLLGAEVRVVEADAYLAAL
jgi:pimeloyl-ACP methyl ester carboxylesterase